MDETFPNLNEPLLPPRNALRQPFPGVLSLLNPVNIVFQSRRIAFYSQWDFKIDSIVGILSTFGHWSLKKNSHINP